MDSIINHDNVNSFGSADYLFQKKIELIVETNNKKSLSEMKNLIIMVNKLNEEIIEIKKQLNGGNRPREKTENLIISKSYRENNEKSSNGADDNEHRPRVRSEDYKPEDVAVDKFFYFGNKR